MPQQYCIIEIDDGWTIADHAEGETAIDAARVHGGVVIDPGPYESYEEACEALEALQGELDEADESSDSPGSQVLDGRYETND